MRNKILITISIFLIAIIFSYGLSVGIYEISPSELLDSSKDTLTGQKTIENNQFVNQVDVGSLIKIDNKSDIDEKKIFLTDFFWNVDTFHRIILKSPLPQVESDISDSRYDDFQNLKRTNYLF